MPDHTRLGGQWKWSTYCCAAAPNRVVLPWPAFAPPRLCSYRDALACLCAASALFIHITLLHDDCCFSCSLSLLLLLTIFVRVRPAALVPGVASDLSLSCALARSLPPRPSVSSSSPPTHAQLLMSLALRLIPDLRVSMCRSERVLPQDAYPVSRRSERHRLARPALVPPMLRSHRICWHQTATPCGHCDLRSAIVPCVSCIHV